MTLRALLVLSALSLLQTALPAQPVNPATEQKPPQEQEPVTPDWRLGSWEMPPTIVRAVREGMLREEDKIGDYNQPRWTAQRLFPTTRIYVKPPGKVEFEHWTRVMVPQEGQT